MSNVTESECRAISIAADELLSYVETVENEGGDEQKLRWAIRKLDGILLREGHDTWVSMPDWGNV